MTRQEINRDFPYYDLDNMTIKSEYMSYFKRLFEANTRVVYIQIEAKQRFNNQIRNEDKILIGRATGGSISLNGKSAVRRSCNLSLQVEKEEGQKLIDSADWPLNTVFGLRAGLESVEPAPWNNEPAGAIIWFPLGEYLITQFSASENLNSFSISISGQDKMAQLNGEVGGVFTQQVKLSEYDQLDNKGQKVETVTLTLDKIVEELVCFWGGEDVDNLINEVESKQGQNLLEYHGDEPMYALYTEETKEDKTTKKVLQNVIIDSEQKVLKGGNEVLISSISDGEQINLIGDTSNSYYVQSFKYGETVGYENVSLTYPGELLAEVGSTITSILDKIKSVFTNFEYFYDVFGRFVFQEKKSYIKTSYPDNNNGVIKVTVENPTSIAWTFKDKEYLISKNINPAIGNVKNDFTVWGTKEGVAGELPIHMRVAIDNKPKSYTASTGITYDTALKEGQEESDILKLVDWRELIYQMALDYNSLSMEERTSYTKTGYEDYYIDLLGFWRQLYNPEEEDQYRQTTGDQSTTQELLYSPWREAEEKDLDTIPLEEFYIKGATEKGEEFHSVWQDTINYENAYRLNLNYVEGKEEENGPQYIDVLEEEFDKKILQPLYKKSITYANEDRTEIKDNLTSIYNIVNAHPEPWNIYLKQGERWIPYQKKNTITASTGQIPDGQDYTSLLYVGNLEQTAYNAILTLQIGTKEFDSGDFSNHNQLGTIIESIQVALKSQTTITYTTQATSEGKTEEFKPLEQCIFYEYQDTIGANTYPAYYSEDKKTYVPLAKKIAEETVSYSIITENGGKIIPTQRKKSYSNLYIKTEQNTYQPFIDIDKRQKYYIQNDDGSYQLYQYVDNLKQKIKDIIIYVRSSQRIKADSVLTKELIGKHYLNGNLASVFERPITYYIKYRNYYIDGDNKYWNKKAIEEPYNRLFWFDFIEPTEGTWYESYGKQNIGKRTKAVSDQKVKVIDNAETPEFIFNADGHEINNYKEYTILSSQAKSAQQAIDEMLYNFSYITQTLSISFLPIYILEPNTVLALEENNNTQYYSIESLNIPLTYNGNMSANITKIFDYKPKGK